MYSKIKEIYDKTRLDVFAMAITYIIDTGYDYVKAITDEEISTMEGNGLMTQDFVHSLVKIAREITIAAEQPTEIIQFCDAEGVFETTYYTGGERLGRRELEKAVQTLLCYILYDEDCTMPTSSEEETKEQLADMLDMDIDDLDKLIERG